MAPPPAAPDPAADVFVKHRADAPEGFFAAEAAGLAWLAAAGADGAAVVDVLGAGRHELRLRRLHPTRPDAAAAERFGRGLAVTHRSGASHFGAAPPGAGGRGWIGPLALPPAPAAPGRDAGDQAPGRQAPGDHDPDGRWFAGDGWGPFFAAARLLPFLWLARERRAVDAAGERAVRAVCDRLAAGDERLTGPPEPPARLHGDLWSGNVVWTAAGAVLIDPSAHGGHREGDLAMLALFGAPHLGRTVAAYQEVWPLAPDWQDRVGLHQLYPLLVHAALFGGGYGDQAIATARHYG